MRILLPILILILNAIVIAYAFILLAFNIGWDLEEQISLDNIAPYIASVWVVILALVIKKYWPKVKKLALISLINLVVLGTFVFATYKLSWYAISSMQAPGDDPGLTLRFQEFKGEFMNIVNELSKSQDGFELCERKNKYFDFTKELKRLKVLCIQRGEKNSLKFITWRFSGGVVGYIYEPDLEAPVGFEKLTPIKEKWYIFRSD